MSNNILVLGAIAPFVDLIEDVKGLGYEPVCCDYYEHAPAKNKVRYAYDVSTMDVDALEKIARKHDVCAVLSAFSDRNLMPAYELAKRLGLPTFYEPKYIALLTNKIEMKKCFLKNGIPVIPYRVIKTDFCDQELSGIKFPVVVKPVDGYGSKGIKICRDMQEIRQEFETAAKASLAYGDTILVEEFYDADEVSVSAWVKNGISYITCTYDVNRNFGEEVSLAYVAFPSKYGKLYQNEFITLVQQITNAVGIKEGPVTVQCYIGNDGLKVGEYLYRLAGGSPYLYPTVFGGPNTAKMLIEYQVGKDIDYQNMESFIPVVKGKYYDILIFVMQEGVIRYHFTKESLENDIPGCRRAFVYYGDGEKIYDISGKGVLAARLFYYQEENDHRSYSEIVQELRERVQICNSCGENITVIRLPDQLRQERIYEIDAVK
ncbi:MAG: ATP-grasp domain-containing protein [bacterium]|nr:ATP-grasp domain-containing protein [bacterium]